MLTVILLIVVGSMGYPVLAQSSDAQEPVEAQQIESNSVREEVQRYFGYEDLLYRYLTLPYDLNQNVNQKGKHVDFGFTLLALLPLILLLLVYKRRRWFYGIAGMMVLYLGMCFRYSHVVATNKRLAAAPDMNLWNDLQVGGELSFCQSLLFAFYNLGIFISTPLRWIIDQLTAQQDHITYPIIVVLLLGMVYLISGRGTMSPKIRVTLLVFSIYSFLWYITSGGIIWYGFLMIPLAIVLMIYGIRNRGKRETIAVRPIFSYFSIGVLSIWLICAYVFRISDINLIENDPDHRGYGIVLPIFFLYSTGSISKAETIDLSTPNISVAMREINKDARRVFQIGTSLIFDIQNNNQRVFEDNTLAVFSELVQTNNSQGLINDVFKNYGFGYILIDLNTPIIDKTPEKSLISKYKVLLAAVKDNPGMRLVATDRKTIQTENGKKVERYAVFGESIPQWGSYAVYEIL